MNTTDESPEAIQKSEAFRVGIIGSYGGLNLGDEAILQSIVQQIRNSVSAEITVFSRNADDTRRRHAVDHVVQVRDMSKREVLPYLTSLDLLVLGGGGILFNGEAKTFLREVEIAHELGIPVMCYAIGAGPLGDPSAQSAVREALNRAQVVTVREKRARQILESVGVEQEIIVTADPALLLEPEPLTAPVAELEALSGKRWVGLSVREPGSAAPDLDISKYHQLLADAADYIIDRYDADIVFIPMERSMKDLQHSHAVVSHMLLPERATVLKAELSQAQVAEVMSRLDFAVGMRLHFLIFAALQNVPFVALPYASKVEGFLESLEIRTPPLHLVNAGRLLAYIDQAWDRRDEIKSKLKRRLPELQGRARQTNEILVRLLQYNRSRKSLDHQQRSVGGNSHAGSPAPESRHAH